MVEHDDAGRPGLRLHQRFHLRIVDAPYFGLVEEVRDLGVVRDEMKAVVLEREVAMAAIDRVQGGVAASEQQALRDAKSALSVLARGAGG